MHTPTDPPSLLNPRYDPKTDRINMSFSTTYLITGANRGRSLETHADNKTQLPQANILRLGIGQGLVAAYLSRPNTTVIAGVRDPSHPTAKALSDLPKGASSSLITVKIDSASPTDAAAAIESLQNKYHIFSLDTVIANAGISATKAFGPVANMKVDDVKEHVNVNAIGPLLLFQATLPLLRKAVHGLGKFVFVSSPIGSIGAMEQRLYPMPAYGASKAMANYLTRKVHFEHEDLVAFAIDPG